MYRILSDLKSQQEIVTLYKSGVSKEKLWKMFKTSNTVIDRILNDFGVDKRDHSHKSRKYSINENYFDIIDTPNKSYILGLLYADGCNYRKTNYIKLELQERDRTILEKINKELCYDKPLKYNELNLKNPNHQNTFLLSITNKHMSETLESLGVIPRKSLKLLFPKDIPNEYMPDFIRGYFDGDGHIEWRKTKFLTIASSKEFCESLQKYLKETYDINSSIYNTSNKESNTKILYLFGKENIYKFLDIMYGIAELYIERKYNQYLYIKGEINNLCQNNELVK